jgi:chemotaxis protein MotB
MQHPRRRRSHDLEEDNHERWLISYADFITLLFAFFVVMYSISSVNEGKYRVLSDALVTSFSSSSGASPIFDKAGDKEIQPITIDEKIPASVLESDTDKSEREREAEEIIELNEISGQIEKQFYEEIENENISVKSNDDWIEVEIKSSLLFRSGIARLNPDAVPIIADLARIIKEYNNPVQVEGFTDDIPINNEQFSSNWELSSSRAVAVLEVLVRNGMEPENLAAIGYGEFQPIADNNTVEGRKENRRVALIISRGAKLRKQMATQESNIVTDLPPDQASIEAKPLINELPVEEVVISIEDNDPESIVSQENINANIDSPVSDAPTENVKEEKRWGIRLEDGGLLFTNDIKPASGGTNEQ